MSEFLLKAAVCNLFGFLVRELLQSSCPAATYSLLKFHGRNFGVLTDDKVILASIQQLVIVKGAQLAS